MMVGRLLSFWGPEIFRGELLNFQGASSLGEVLEFHLLHDGATLLVWKCCESTLSCPRCFDERKTNKVYINHFSRWSMFFLRCSFFLQFSALISEKPVSHQSPLSHVFPQKKSPEPPTFPRSSASLRRDLISKLFRLAHHVSNLPIRSSRRWNAIGTEISDGDHLESREGQLGPSPPSELIHSPNLDCQF